MEEMPKNYGRTLRKLRCSFHRDGVVREAELQVLCFLKLVCPIDSEKASEA